jgi:hypothetical protein
MQEITVTTRDGEILKLYKANDSTWCCPVCGSPELSSPPQTDEGGSYEMCSCGFEFGFDDEPAASAQAVDGVRNNWIRWREMLFRKHSHQPEKINQLKSQLAKIDLDAQF